MERIYVVEHPMDEQCLTPQQLLKYQDILKQASEQNDGITKKRERSENWTADEKDFLVECIRDRKDILLNITGIPHTERFKKWVEIEKLMQVKGYNRKVKHIRQQWKVIKRQTPPNFLFEEINKSIEENGTDIKSEPVNDTQLPEKLIEVPEKNVKPTKRRLIELPQDNMCKKVFVEVVPDILLHKPTSTESHEERLQRLQIQKLETNIQNQRELHNIEIELLELKKRKEQLQIRLLEKQLDQ